MSTRGNDSRIPEHVFISFSQKDKAVAEAIVYSLWKSNIPAWIDYAKLVPGTADWETAIRDAIEASFAIVVLASPDSRESKYVRGELNVAESKGRQIYPVWIDGTDWADCIPLGMTYAQYIDARENQREEGIAKLCELLRQHIRNATPRHYHVFPLRRIVGEKQNTTLRQVSPPPGFISVEFTEGENDEWKDGGNGAFFRISDYSCVQAFLDELYINYISDQFEPFTYGSSWILEQIGEYCCVFLVPWSWLVRPHASSELENEWLHHTPLSDCGLLPGTRWRLNKTTDVEYTGLAINDERILRALRGSPKAEYFLRREGILDDVTVDQVGPHYRFRFVISPIRFFDRQIKPGMVTVQTQKALTEELIGYWLERR
jgi:hypothetical protein